MRTRGDVLCDLSGPQGAPALPRWGPSLSVIVPTLDEAPRVGSLLASLHAELRGDDELLLVDGGSRDGTLEVARSLGLPLLTTLLAPPGRGAQMNHAAARARGEWLWFVHADSLLPTGSALERVRQAAAAPGARWGFCRVRVHAPGPLFRAIELGMNTRSAVCRTPSGDQGIFVERGLFAELGGYPSAAVAEDLLLVDRLRDVAPPVIASTWLGTSARRWRRAGVLRTILRMWALRAAFRLGASPERLARHYPAVR